MAILQVLVLGLIGANMASACTTQPRGGPPIESGTLDIPIHLQFQQNPIPSASLSIGLDSKINQNVGNGVYRQTQFKGNLDVSGAAVPVLDANHEVKGISADIDTHIDHDNKVVFLDHDPMRPTTASPKPFTAGASSNQVTQNNQAQRQQNANAASASAFVNGKRPLKVNDNSHDDDEEEHKKESNVGGLKLEYFIAIICVAGACFLALIVVVVIVARRRKVDNVECNHRNSHRGHHSHRPHHASSIYSAPSAYIPELVIDQKPPSYDSEMKSGKVDSRRSSSSASDFEKKY